jgi:CheY-like chemotaxis protein
MVLDASRVTRKILEIILRREGFRVICFGDPVGALQYLFHHRLPDLLFLSIDLPRMDGYRVLTYVKSNDRYHQVILVALLNPRDGVLGHLRARLAGAQRTVVKPLIRQQIVTLVSAYRSPGVGTHDGSRSL